MPREAKSLAENAFCRNFRKERREREMTQTELGRLSNLSVKQIAHYETGTCIPSIEQAVAIARALGKSMDELCETEHFIRKEEKRV